MEPYGPGFSPILTTSSLNDPGQQTPWLLWVCISLPSVAAAPGRVLGLNVKHVKYLVAFGSMNLVMVATVTVPGAPSDACLSTVI